MMGWEFEGEGEGEGEAKRKRDKGDRHTITTHHTIPSHTIPIANIESIHPFSSLPFLSLYPIQQAFFFQNYYLPFFSSSFSLSRVYQVTKEWDG